MIHAIAAFGRPAARPPAAAAKATAPQAADATTGPCCPSTLRLSPDALTRMADVLVADFRGLSWSRDPEAKGQLAQTLGVIGTDNAIATLVDDYRGLSWSRDANFKRQVLAALVATRHDLAAAPITESYRELSWSREPMLKFELLQALRRLATPLAKPAE